MAITVRIARDVLAGHGFDPNLVCLAAGAGRRRLAADLAVRPEIGIVDFTGSSAFGDWLEAHARQAQVYTEKAGVNGVIVDSTDDYRGMLANLAFSLVLYSGQMCTTPQNLFVSRDGIDTDAGHVSVDQLGADLGKGGGRPARRGRQGRRTARRRGQRRRARAGSTRHPGSGGSSSPRAP
jgi:hypothetical protein